MLVIGKRSTRFLVISRRYYSRSQKWKSDYKRDYIRHYENNHDNTPVWILMNYLMLGQAFKVYEFQPESMRNSIAMSFSDF